MSAFLVVWEDGVRQGNVKGSRRYSMQPYAIRDCFDRVACGDIVDTS